MLEIAYGQGYLCALMIFLDGDCSGSRCSSGQCVVRRGNCYNGFQDTSSDNLQDNTSHGTNLSTPYIYSHTSFIDIYNNI